jgi:16S rRNA (guanine527-N7)-methyltransferase
MDYPELLERQASAWGLFLGRVERDRLLEYARLLASYEQSNVIGTKDLNSIVLHHVLDSLSCFLFGPLSRAGRLADVGSGGGLPGMPIKIAKPDLQTTLIESTGKKSRFLDYAAGVLALDGVMVANARVEDLAHSSAHRGTYDVVTTRAVAHLSVIAEYCVPLLRVGGSAISMKARLEGAELSEGQRAVELVGAKISERIRVPSIPEAGDKERQLVIIEKVRETHPRYPRKPGTPTKRPLGAG